MQINKREAFVLLASTSYARANREDVNEALNGEGLDVPINLEGGELTGDSLGENEMEVLAARLAAFLQEPDDVVETVP